MSKYIIEIEEKPLCVFDKDTQTYFPKLWHVKGFNSLVLDEEGLSRLEELTSDYINEHFGDLQDDAYNKGYAQCQDDYSDALKHAKDMAYKKGLEEGREQNPCDTCAYRHNELLCADCKWNYGSRYKVDSIGVGDVVRHKINGLTYIVTLANECGYVLLDGDGNFATSCITNTFEKTGRHFDIASILEEMKHD